MTQTQSSTRLPRYSGAKPECAKCGYGGASTEFMATGDCHHPDHVENTYERVSNPRLHRACLRCDYQWDEATLDAE